MLFPPLEIVNTAGPVSVPPAAVVRPPKPVIWPSVLEMFVRIVYSMDVFGFTRKGGI